MAKGFRQRRLLVFLCGGGYINLGESSSYILPEVPFFCHFRQNINLFFDVND
jgi:hypothetical protein